MRFRCFSLIMLAGSLLLIILLLCSLSCKSSEYNSQEPAFHEIFREMRVPAIDMQEAYLQDVVDYLNSVADEYGLSKARKGAIIVFECPAPLSQRKLNSVPAAMDKPIDAGMTKIVSIMDLVDEVCSRANVNLIIKSSRAIFTSE